MKIYHHSYPICKRHFGARKFLTLVSHQRDALTRSRHGCGSVLLALIDLFVLLISYADIKRSSGPWPS